MTTPFTKNNITDHLGWISELVKFELSSSSSNTFSSLNTLDPRQAIEESTIDLLEELKDIFTNFARIFNSHSENNSKFSEVKIYNITNTAADFMLFRNNTKLVFANTAHGIINISFQKHQRSSLKVDSDNNSIQTSSKDLIAQLGAFNDVIWTFQGEKVDLNKLAKFYFIEFIKHSKEEKKPSQNELILEQIKALLQDKGINL
jgi:hypothetical protein